MPSVVSMPPNIITAAFDTTSAGVRSPARLERRLDRVAQLLERRAPASVVGSLPAATPVDRLDDRVVPAEHRARVRRLEPEQLRDDARGERAGELAPKLRVAVGLERVDQRVDLRLDERREPLPHGGEPERLGERIAVARVLARRRASACSGRRRARSRSADRRR